MPDIDVTLLLTTLTSCVTLPESLSRSFFVLRKHTSAKCHALSSEYSVALFSEVREVGGVGGSGAAPRAEGPKGS